MSILNLDENLVNQFLCISKNSFIQLKNINKFRMILYKFSQNNAMTYLFLSFYCCFISLRSNFYSTEQNMQENRSRSLDTYRYNASKVDLRFNG